MLESAEFCRERAHEEREAAAKATLPLICQRHLDAAQRWEQIAGRGEKYADQRAAVIAARQKGDDSDRS